jgi:signal transduction histidine kinase
VAQLALARSSHRICLTAPESLPTVTNQLRVRQVVDNLLDNACKFSPPGSPIEVTLAEVDGHAELRVRDLGRGIPPDELERVFERFQRVEDPMHMTTSGAGLGLYIVRALIEGLGGTITLDSVLGAGTTVTVRLPLRAAGA